MVTLSLSLSLSLSAFVNVLEKGWCHVPLGMGISKGRRSKFFSLVHAGDIVRKCELAFSKIDFPLLHFIVLCNFNSERNSNRRQQMYLDYCSSFVEDDPQLSFHQALDKVTSKRQKANIRSKVATWVTFSDRLKRIDIQSSATIGSMLRDPASWPPVDPV